MELLKRMTAAVAALSILAAGCGSEHDILTIPLETDTTISSEEYVDQADLDTIAVEKTAAGAEKRALVKLPTGSREEETNLQKIVDDILVTIFFIPWGILTRWANCKAEALIPANVNSASLDFSVASGTVVAGDLKMSLVSKAWWHDATWVRAHSFSDAGGVWSAGGEVYPAATFAPLVSTMNASDVRFDITNYFKALITDEAADNDNRTPHYGFRIDANAATLSEVRLKSVQTLLSTEGPRIVVDYDTTGTCGDSVFPDLDPAKAEFRAALEASGPMAVVSPLAPGAHPYYVPAGAPSSVPVIPIQR